MAWKQEVSYVRVVVIDEWINIRRLASTEDGSVVGANAPLQKLTVYAFLGETRDPKVHEAYQGLLQAVKRLKELETGPVGQGADATFSTKA